MTTFQRDISEYYLVCADTADELNDTVNDLIREGFQPRNDRGTEIQYHDNGIHFRMEMVRYVPEQVMVDPRATQANTTTEEHERRIAMLRGNPVETEPVEEHEIDMAVPAPPPNTHLWTVDSPDPFDDEGDEDENEVSDRRLGQLGALVRDWEDQMNEVVEDAPVRVPESLRRAVREMTEAGIIGHETERDLNRMERAIEEPQTESVMDMVDNVPF